MAVIRPVASLESLVIRPTRASPRRASFLVGRQFGARACVAPVDPPVATTGLGDDLRLFAVTFAAGFLFVSILIG
jgi:hypothetical protein